MRGRHIQTHLGGDDEPDSAYSEGTAHPIGVDLGLPLESCDGCDTSSDGVCAHTSEQQRSSKLKDSGNLNAQELAKLSLRIAPVRARLCLRY